MSGQHEPVEAIMRRPNDLHIQFIGFKRMPPLQEGQQQPQSRTTGSQFGLDSWENVTSLHWPAVRPVAVPTQCRHGSWPLFRHEALLAGAVPAPARHKVAPGGFHGGPVGKVPHGAHTHGGSPRCGRCLVVPAAAQGRVCVALR